MEGTTIESGEMVLHLNISLQRKAEQIGKGSRLNDLHPFKPHLSTEVWLSHFY